MLIVLALVAVVGSHAWSALQELRRERAGREAARGVLADLRQWAAQARTSGRSLAVEIDAAAGTWRVLVDGNANGVTTADITAGVDPVQTDWTPVVREGDARLAITRNLPAVDDGNALSPGSAPVRLGAAPRLTFTARGTSTAASIYLAGPNHRAYVVRLLGTTQRARLQCLSADNHWEAC